MADKEFNLDTSFTETRSYLRPLGAIVAVLGIALIVLSITTGLADRLVPMDDRYLTALVPRAADGNEPIALQNLTQTLGENDLTIDGDFLNRTDYAISGVVVMIEIKDRFTLVAETREVVPQPEEIPAQTAAKFSAVFMHAGELGGYSVRFKLKDGPFIPHKDERSPVQSVTPN